MSNLLYLISSIFFIVSLQSFTSPKYASKGNTLGILGMISSILATLMLVNGTFLIIVGILVGGLFGSYIAMRVKMTQMPQLVAGFHSLVGLAACFVAFAAYLSPHNFNIGLIGAIPGGHLFEMSLGLSIGAITFTGSIVAFMKLANLSNKSGFEGQKYLSIALGIILFLLISVFPYTESVVAFMLIFVFSCLLGILLITPVGGADMPVVVSMLNSYSGWATVGIGFTLSNNLLIITGSLVGASGAILSYIMCKAMNRSLYNVLFGVFTKKENIAIADDDSEGKSYIEKSPQEASGILQDAKNVIIVPGYGMAVAQAQHIIKELVQKLEEKGITVKFAIHPVAGRMPGHMNVLLAEAGINYEKVFELDEINDDFGSCDVAIVIGANDITNPAAKNDPDSPIYGMPILEVENAKTVFFIKRSMSSGYAGIDNELFYASNTNMLFGDGKKVITEIVNYL